jgi:hypothetical protein
MPGLGCGPRPELPAEVSATAVMIAAISEKSSAKAARSQTGSLPACAGRLRTAVRLAINNPPGSLFLATFADSGRRGSHFPWHDWRVACSRRTLACAANLITPQWRWAAKDWAMLTIVIQHAPSLVRLNRI